MHRIDKEIQTNYCFLVTKIFLRDAINVINPSQLKILVGLTGYFYDIAM